MSDARPRPDPGAAAAAATSGSRRVVVVAGMHRAGTSVVARGLQTLGVDLGDRLMSADLRVNARGFFEDHDIVNLDDALLATQGADWKNLALLEGLDWRAPAFAGSRAAARELIESRLRRSGLFAFKDPRVPRLLPFWQLAFAELAVADAYVIAVRHPLSVIDSLSARDALDVRRSAWLWVTHLLCSLHYTTGRPRVVVDYDRLLAAPVRELARMARGLGLPAPERAGNDVAAYTDAFLSGEMRHAQHAAGDPGGAAAIPLLRDVYALVQRLACDEADAGSAATETEVAGLFRRLMAYSPLLAYAGATEHAADEAPRLSGELEWARSSLAESTAFSESLRATLREKEALRLDAQRHAESLAAALRSKDEALASAQAYNDDLRVALQRKDEALAAARTCDDDLRAALAHKDEALAAARTCDDDLRAALARKDEALAAAQTYNDDLQATLICKDEALAVAQTYNDDLQATLRRKDEALAAAQTYNDDLRATLQRKDEALAVAQGAIDDLQARLSRVDAERLAANDKLDRIRQRVLGRMLLRRIER